MDTGPGTPRRFSVFVASRDSGRVTVLTLDAASEEEAMVIANARGYLVSRVVPLEGPSLVTEPAAPAEAPAAADPLLNEAVRLRHEIASIRAGLDALQRSPIILRPRATIAQGMLIFVAVMLLIWLVLVTLTALILTIAGVSLAGLR